MIRIKKMMNEGGTGTLRLTFTDENGAPVTPSKVTYTIHDVASGTSVRASTEETPSSSVHNISLIAADNAIVDASSVTEQRLVTLVADYGSGKKIPEEVVYPVRNMAKLP